jgi:hypothetical protein
MTKIQIKSVIKSLIFSNSITQLCLLLFSDREFVQNKLDFFICVAIYLHNAIARGFLQLVIEDHRKITSDLSPNIYDDRLKIFQLNKFTQVLFFSSLMSFTIIAWVFSPLGWFTCALLLQDVYVPFHLPTLPSPSSFSFKN